MAIKATERETVADILEAECRVLMTAIAKLPRRGWDSERSRAAWLKRLDVKLDAWNQARS